jgi:foldase protein PrsA
MKKVKGSTIAICVLVVCVLVETILLITGALTKVPKNANGEDIVVSLNDGTQLTVNDVYKEMKSKYALTTILESIDSKILTTEFADKKDEVEKYVSNAKSNLKANYGSDQELETALQNYGYESLEDYLSLVRTSQYNTYATTEYAKTLITDDEIKKYYDEKVYGDMSGVHILVKPASTSNDDLDKAKKKAEEVLKAIKEDVNNGTDVKEAFEKYKDDTSVTYQDLGTFNYTQMDEAFSKAAYALKVNEMSSTPVKSSFGYHIILKTAEFDKPSLDDKKEEIKTTLAETKSNDDSTLSVKAMINLRNKYGFSINDSDIQTYYDRSINRQLNPTTTNK